jgi:hypothetical protein
MVRHKHYRPPTCHHSSLSLSPSCPTPHISYPPSFSLDAKSCMNTKVNYTRGFSVNHKMALSVSASNRTLTRSQKTEGSHCLILHLLGKIYASMESSSQGTNHRHSSTPARPTISMRWHPRLVLSASNVNAPNLSLPDSTPPTLIGTRGWQVSARRNPALNHKTHTSRPHPLSKRSSQGYSYNVRALH